MGNPIIGGLTRVMRFSGRDSRARFWPCALAVTALTFIAMSAPLVIEINKTFAGLEQYAAEHPERATVTQGPGHYSIQVEGSVPGAMPDFGFLITVTGAVMLGAVVLLAAAVARRLHDTGRAGYWGLLPLPFMAFGLFGFGHLLQQFMTDEPDLRLFAGLFLNNMLYLLALAGLVWLLCGVGTPGSNRFGPAPDENA